MPPQREIHSWGRIADQSELTINLWISRFLSPRKIASDCKAVISSPIPTAPDCRRFLDRVRSAEGVTSVAVSGRDSLFRSSAAVIRFDVEDVSREKVIDAIRGRLAGASTPKAPAPTPAGGRGSRNGTAPGGKRRESNASRAIRKDQGNGKDAPGSAEKLHRHNGHAQNPKRKIGAVPWCDAHQRSCGRGRPGAIWPQRQARPDRD